MASSYGEFRKKIESIVGFFLKKIEGILGFYLKRTMAAAAIGIAVGLLLDFFHDKPPMVQFERAGSDAAMRYYASILGKGTIHPRVVVVILGQLGGEAMQSVGSGGTAEDLISLLQFIRKLGPASILLDIQIENTVQKHDLYALETEFKKNLGGNEIFIPLHVTPFREGQLRFRDAWLAQPENDVFPDLHLDYIRRVVPAIEADSDGVIRRVAPWACVLPVDEGWTTYPTLAFAASPKRISVGDSRAACPNPKNLKRQTIFFRSRELDSTGPIPIIGSDEFKKCSPSTAPAQCDRSVVDQIGGAVVLIGQMSWEDMHVTPLGLMPGVLVQANAVLTTLENSDASQPSNADRFLHLTADVVIVAGILGIFPIAQWLLSWLPIVFFRWASSRLDPSVVLEMPTAPWKKEHCRPKKERSYLSFGEAAIHLVAAALPVVIIARILWFLVGRLQIDYATDQLSRGVIVGTFMPLLAVALETFVDIAEYVIRFADASIESGIEIVRCVLVYLGRLLRVAEQ